MNCYYRNQLALAQRCLQYSLMLLPLVLAGDKLNADTDDIQQAKYAFSLGQWDKAFSLFEQAQQKDPQDGTPFFYMGYIREQQNRKTESIPYYESALPLKLEKELRKKCFWKIVLYYKQVRDWESLFDYSSEFLQIHDSKAVRKLQELAQQNYDPNKRNARNLYKRAQVEKKQGLLRQSQTTLEKAVIYDSDFLAAHWELALYKMQAQNFRGALPHLQQLTTQRAESWQYHYKMAVCYYRLQEYSAALRALQKSHKLYLAHAETNGAVSEKTDADTSFIFYVNYMQGNIYLAQAQFEKARQALHNALALRPLTKIHISLAKAYWHLRKYEAALEHAQLASRKKEKNTLSEALLYLTLYQYHQKQPKKAYASAWRIHQLLAKNKSNQTANAEEIAAATARQEQYTPAYLMLAEEAWQKKKWLLTLRFLQKITHDENLGLLHNMDQDSSLYQLGQKYNYYYATALMHARKAKQALEYYAKLDDTPETYWQRARCHALLLQTSAAQTNLEKGAPPADQDNDVQLAYWQRITKDSFLQKLLRNDPIFANFVTARIQALTKDNINKANAPPSAR